MDGENGISFYTSCKAQSSNSNAHYPVTNCISFFFLVDKCGDELPCIHEAFQSIQDEPFVSVFTGCVLLSVHDCDRIYYNVIRRVSNNTEMSILLVLRGLTN